jgi:hypothetical protein
MFARHLQERTPIREREDALFSDDDNNEIGGSPSQPSVPTAPAAASPAGRSAASPKQTPKAAPEPTESPGAAKKRKASSVAAAASPKRNKCGTDDQKIIATITSPNAKLVIDDKHNLVLISAESIPKKVAKDQVYKKYTGAEELEFGRRSALAANGACLHKFSVTPQSLVYSQEAQKLLTVREFIRKYSPQATSITGYKSFPAGCVPTKLEENKDLVAKIKDPLLQSLLKMCQDKKTIVLTWAVTYNKEKQQVRPSGLILVNPTQFSIQAKEEKVL